MSSNRHDWNRPGWRRPVRIWRAKPGRWEAYCPGCDYQGSTELLMDIATTWTGALALANEHLADSHPSDRSDSTEEER